jgi:hypothetical protein
MTVEQFFEAVPEDINSTTHKSIYGKSLLAVKTYLNTVDVFKDCNIQILLQPQEITNNKHVPVLTYKYTEGLQFNKDVKLFGIFQTPDGWGFRATKDSVK